MSENTVTVRSTRDAIRKAFASIPGAARSNSAAADAMMARIGLAVLARIKQAFVTKARGGTDDAGDRWKPLSPRTVAYSKTRSRGRGGRSRTEKGQPTRPSQALTTAQRDRWWAVYRRQLAIHDGDRGRAAAVAWFVLKSEGATTLLEKYGNRQVEILRDTGLLLNSLSPGVSSAERIFRVGRGEVIVGTNRKGAAAHHKGVVGRLPQRRLWPEVGRWPASWWRDIIEQAKQGLLDIATTTIRRSA